jgi:hypothetical protein
MVQSTVTCAPTTRSGPQLSGLLRRVDTPQAPRRISALLVCVAMAGSYGKRGEEQGN